MRKVAPAHPADVLEFATRPDVVLGFYCWPRAGISAAVNFASLLVSGLGVENDPLNATDWHAEKTTENNTKSRTGHVPEGGDKSGRKKTRQNASSSCGRAAWDSGFDATGPPPRPGLRHKSIYDAPADGDGARPKERALRPEGAPGLRC